MGEVETGEDTDKGRLLSELRVADLKTELEKRGLESSGVKVVLTVRLNKALQSEGVDPATYRFFNVATKSSPVKKVAAVPPRKIEALAKMAESNYMVETKCEQNMDEKREDNEEKIKNELKMEENVGLKEEHFENEHTLEINIKQELVEQEEEEKEYNQNNIKSNEENTNNCELVDNEIQNDATISDEKYNEEEKDEGEEAEKVIVLEISGISEGKEDNNEQSEISFENNAQEPVGDNLIEQEEKETEDNYGENGEEELEEVGDEELEGEDDIMDEEEEYENEEGEEEDNQGKQKIQNNDIRVKKSQNDDDMLDDPLSESRKSATPQPAQQKQQQEQSINDEVMESPSEPTEPIVTENEYDTPIVEDDVKFRSLWIRGLTTETSAANLKQLCMVYGKVQRAKIFNSRSRKGDVTTCFGYVVFTEQSMCDACLDELNGTFVYGKQLTLERASESTLFDSTQRKTYHHQPAIEIKAPVERKRIVIDAPETKRETSKERKEREEREKARRERKPIVYKRSPERVKKSPIRTKSGSEPREIKTSQRRITAAVTSASSRVPRQFITTHGPMTESLIIRTRVSPVSDSIHRSVERGIQNISTSSLRRKKPVVTIPSHSHQSRPIENEPRRREDQTRSRERERERDRQKERELEEILRRKEEEHRHRERELELQRERDRIRFEKEKLERERLEFELQKQKMALERAREVSSSYSSSRGHSERGDTSSRYSRETERRNISSNSSSHRDDRSHRGDSRRDVSSRRRFEEDMISPPRKVHTDDRDTRRRDVPVHIPMPQRSTSGNVYGIQSGSSRGGYGSATKDYSGISNYRGASSAQLNAFGSQDTFSGGSSRGTYSNSGTNGYLDDDLANLERHIGVSAGYQSSGALPTWGGLNANGELDLGNSSGPWNTQSTATSSSRGANDWNGSYDSRSSRQPPSSQFFRGGY